MKGFVFIPQTCRPVSVIADKVRHFTLNSIEFGGELDRIDCCAEIKKIMKN